LLARHKSDTEFLSWLKEEGILFYIDGFCDGYPPSWKIYARLLNFYGPPNKLRLVVKFYVFQINKDITGYDLTDTYTRVIGYKRSTEITILGTPEIIAARNAARLKKEPQ
jgi:hypothetical protein